MGQGNKKQRTAGKSKTGTGRTGRQQETQEVPEFLRGEVMIIVSLAAAVLLFLSNFHLCGVVGDFLRSVQLGLFGIVGYAFPILLFMGISFYVSNAGSLKAVIKLLGVTGVVLTVCGLAQMVFGFWPGEGDSILAFYRESSLSGSGGGLMGGILAFMLRSVVGNIGAYLILIALLIICCVVVTEKSVVNFVKRGSGKVYRHAREDVARRKEEWAEIQEERRRGREDNIVRGIDFGSIRIQQGMGTEQNGAFADVADLPGRQGKKSRNDVQQTEADMTAVPEPDVMTQGTPLPPYAGMDTMTPGTIPPPYAGMSTVAQETAPPPYTGMDVSVPENTSAAVPERRRQVSAAETDSLPNRGGNPPLGQAYPPEQEGMTENRIEEMGRGQEESLSADVFSGRIEIPPEYMEPVPFEEDKIISIASAASGRWAKSTASVRKNEPLYARREIKTLEELDMTLSDLESSLERGSWMDETLSGDFSGGKLPEEGAGADDFLDSDYQDDELFVDEDGFAEDERYLRKSPEASDTAYANTAVAEEDSPLYLGDMEEPVRLDDEQPYSSSGNRLFAGDRFDRETAGETDTEDNDADEEEPGIIGVSRAGDGSIFVPEEPKRVVTASGKVIETETEILHKKLERRREEAREENPFAAVQAEKPKPVVKKDYVFPPTTLLQRGNRNQGLFSDQEYKETAIKLQQTLKNFGVGVTVTNISCGPSVTRYELHPEQGVKVSKIVSLTDDIKLSLAAAEIRIEAPIPGKSAVGIEVPNKETAMVYLRDLLESEGFLASKSRLTFAVGKDIGGQPVMADIGKMPHLLIAGATGSGKSVCINTLIMSIIFKADPEDVKLIMVDPKVVELSVYNGIPHLLIPVVTDPKKASGALNWAVAEMEDRYRKFAQYNVRNLQGYNDKIKLMDGMPEEERPKKMPQIVIIIDELADLMMVVPGEVEDAICRLAQLARAAGIHLVIATQRPSVNVITGLIKANVPSRIAFAVSSGVDSRTIIDMNGAEKLLGKGDMLFFPSGIPKPQRVQGAFVSDQEVSNVVEFLTEQGLTADYNTDVENRVASGNSMPSAGADNSRDEYFAQAGKFIIEKEKASIGMLQRIFKIGFNRAARIMDQLADAGVVGEEEGTKPRKVLMTMEEFEQFINN